MTHPSEWPTLLKDYPVALYLQHSEWAQQRLCAFFGDKCRIWPVGIDTCRWRPIAGNRKPFDFVIYDKILWNRDRVIPALLDPIRDELARRGLSFVELRYGCYDEDRYEEVLRQAGSWCSSASTRARASHIRSACRAASRFWPGTRMVPRPQQIDMASVGHPGDQRALFRCAMLE